MRLSNGLTTELLTFAYCVFCSYPTVSLMFGGQA